MKREPASGRKGNLFDKFLLNTYFSARHHEGTKMKKTGTRERTYK